MSLTQEAIQYINDLAIASAAKPETVDMPVAVLPNSMSLHDLEPYRQHRNAFRGEYTTHSIDDFKTYIAQQPSAKVFADCADGQVVAFFDLGTLEKPGHAHHYATLVLRETEAFKTFKLITKERLTQRRIATYIEDYQHFIRYLRDDQGEQIPLGSAIQSIRNLKIESAGSHEHTTQTLSSRTSSLEQIDISKNALLPTHMDIELWPYEGTHPITFTVRILTILTDETKTPQFRLDKIRFGELMDTFAHDLFAQFSELSADNVEVYQGRFNPM